MSHELRTPLNIIVGYSDMLAEGVVGPLTREQHDTVARVQRAGVELLDLVNATLDMGRLEAGRDAGRARRGRSRRRAAPARHRARAARGAGVRAALAEPARRRRSCTDRVEAEDDPEEPGRQRAQVHAPAAASTCWRTGKASASRCEVRDTGIGIPAESLPVIFEMFRQGDGSSTRTFGGVGLGLHIVRRLVDLLGGDVSVESTLGVGSTFVVSWPATPADAARSSVA